MKSASGLTFELAHSANKGLFSKIDRMLKRL